MEQSSRCYQVKTFDLTKQNQLILDQLHEDAKAELQSVFDEEEQRWLDNYIKEHNLNPFLNMIDID